MAEATKNGKKRLASERDGTADVKTNEFNYVMRKTLHLAKGQGFGKESSPQSNTSSVHDDGPSPPTGVTSKPSSDRAEVAQDAGRTLSFSDESGEETITWQWQEARDGESSSCVVKRLKALCSIREPIMKVGMEMAGKAYLLKFKRQTSKEIRMKAFEQAQAAAEALIEAGNLLSESQKSIDQVL